MKRTRKGDAANRLILAVFRANGLLLSQEDALLAPLGSAHLARDCFGNGIDATGCPETAHSIDCPAPARAPEQPIESTFAEVYPDCQSVLDPNGEKPKPTCEDQASITSRPKGRANV